MLWPLAIRPTMVPTVTRKPRMHGLPPMISGERVIRVSGVMSQVPSRRRLVPFYDPRRTRARLARASDHRARLACSGFVATFRHNGPQSPIIFYKFAFSGMKMHGLKSRNVVSDLGGECRN